MFSLDPLYPFLITILCAGSAGNCWLWRRWCAGRSVKASAVITAVLVASAVHVCLVMLLTTLLVWALVIEPPQQERALYLVGPLTLMAMTIPAFTATLRWCSRPADHARC